MQAKSHAVDIPLSAQHADELAVQPRIIDNVPDAPLQRQCSLANQNVITNAMCCCGCCGDVKAHSVWHFGPLISTYLAASISYTTVWCVASFESLTTFQQIFITGLYLMIMSTAVLNLYISMYVGGGTIPKGWQPENEENKASLLYCTFCEGYMPPRSHHCHKCKVCVPRLDHHCPWINSCVGIRNHVPFLIFITLCVATCFFGATIQVIFLNSRWDQFMKNVLERQTSPTTLFDYFTNTKAGNKVLFDLYTLSTMASAIGTGVGVSLLCVYQFKNILYNQTSVEDFVVEKAKKRTNRTTEFVFPYFLGYTENVKELFKQWYSGDGITWTIRRGCDTYTMTREQVAQQAAKRFKLVRIKHRFGHRWCLPRLQFGFKRWRNAPPSLFESIVRVDVGEVMKITQKLGEEWYYGEKVSLLHGEYRSVSPRQRGWFPVEARGDYIDNFQHNNSNNNNNNNNNNDNNDSNNNKKKHNDNDNNDDDNNNNGNKNNNKNNSNNNNTNDDDYNNHTDNNTKNNNNSNNTTNNNNNDNYHKNENHGEEVPSCIHTKTD